MITEIITTYLLNVNGFETLPVDATETCECIRHSRSTTCTINNLISQGRLLKVVSITGPNGEAINDRVVVVCKQ